MNESKRVYNFIIFNCIFSMIYSSSRNSSVFSETIKYPSGPVKASTNWSFCTGFLKKENHLIIYFDKLMLTTFVYFDKMLFTYFYDKIHPKVQNCVS